MGYFAAVKMSKPVCVDINPPWFPSFSQKKPVSVTATRLLHNLALGGPQSSPCSMFALLRLLTQVAPPPLSKQPPPPTLFNLSPQHSTQCFTYFADCPLDQSLADYIPCRPNPI